MKEIVSLNFNADGDKILTGSFDGTAIVKNCQCRFGIQNLENLFIFLEVILEKSHLLSSNLEDICVVLPLSTELVGFGMSGQGNACQCSEDILMKYLILTSMLLELVWSLLALI